MAFTTDGPFCVSAYMDKDTHERGGESKDTYHTTELEAKAAYDRLVAGGHFYAIAYGYRGATGEFDDFEEWTQDD